VISNLGNLLSQSETKKYPYTTIDEDGVTKVVVMTTEQADLINKKYKEMEAELNTLKATIKTQRDTITKQKVIIQTQIDTILKQEIVIKTQVDTITKYNEKVVYIETDKDSLSTEYTSLQDSLWKWALGPTLIYTTYPDTDVVYLMDLSQYYFTTDDFGIIMVKMSEKEYKKYLLFKQTYGLTEEVFWQFRNEVKVKRLKQSDLEDRKVWKYRRKYKKYN
jgi:hypothetical protein